jgi:sialate O-acetylesterase
MKESLLLFFITSVFINISSAQIKLPDIISDSMVLQQNTDAPLWGWATAGTKVEVKGSWSSKSVQTVAGNDGKWMVKIPTPNAGGPYDVTINAGDTKTLHGVLIGEVWICSGQSNMEMPVAGWPGAPIKNSAKEIADANYPEIRTFTGQKQIAFSPQQNVKGSWSSCSPASAGTFSATAYFFARELYNHLHIPIGLVHVSWGGTIAEAWTSETSLRTMGDFNKGLDVVDSMRTDSTEIIERGRQNQALWNKELAESNNSYSYASANTDTSWHNMQLPTYWEDAGLPDLDGIVWFKRTIDIPAAWAGKDLKLDLGPVDDMDVTWFNGKIVDSTMKDGAWMTERHYTVPADLVKAGTNIIAVKVIDNQGNGGIYGKPEALHIYPVGGTVADAIPLSGNWNYKVAAVKPPPAMNQSPNQPTVLFNGMIAPVIPFAIKGAIWYQGEANVGRAKQYTTLFPLMISDWRKLWSEGDFPFYFVQIAPFNYGGDSTLAAALRDAQRRTLDLSANTGMAVTMDIGEKSNIHPADKQDVGKRLSYWALNKTYNEKNVVVSGPLYKSFEVKDNKIIVSFTNTEGGLTSNNKPMQDFELEGADGVWKPATATIEGDKVTVTSNFIDKPVAVRYAFYSYAAGTLFNGAGLPASSFTSADLK